jgi:hypothetical protein
MSNQVSVESTPSEYMGQTRLDLAHADGPLSWVILVLGLLTMLVGATQIVTSHSLVPLWDEWQEIDVIATAHNHWPPVQWLWALHNEHRIIFYRLLLLADIHLFHGTHWISFWSMLVVQCLFLATIAWMLLTFGVNGALWRSVVGLAAFCLFCPTQWENFGWAFQISFLLPGFLAALSLAALLMYNYRTGQSRHGWIYFALSIFAACAATFSSAIGVILWPMLLLVASALRVRPWVIEAYLGFGLILVGSYFYHYQGPSIHSSPFESLRHPIAVLTYSAGYMGIVLPAWVKSRELVAVASGSVGLITALVSTLWALGKKRGEPLPMALIGFIFFTVSTAFITALGRLGLGLPQAFSSRYQTFNLLFWFSTVTLVLFFVSETSRMLRTLTLTALAGGMFLALFVFPLGIRASRTRTQQAEAAATALLTGVADQTTLRVLFEDSSLVWRDAMYFRRQHLFMFSDSNTGELGQSLVSAYRIASSQHCRGQATMVEQLSAEDLLADKDTLTLRINGWALDGSNAPFRRLVFAADGRTVGFAASLAGPLSAKHSELVRNPNPSGWMGFALPNRIEPIEIYAVDNRGATVCHVATINAL